MPKVHDSHGAAESTRRPPLPASDNVMGGAGAAQGFSAAQLMLKPASTPGFDQQTAALSPDARNHLDRLPPKNKAELAALSPDEQAELMELDEDELEVMLGGPAAQQQPEPLSTVQAKGAPQLQLKKAPVAPRVQAKGAKKVGPAKGHFVKKASELDDVPSGVAGFNMLVNKGKYGHAFAHLLKEPIAVASTGFRGITTAKQKAFAQAMIRNADTTSDKGKKILDAFVLTAPELTDTATVKSLFQVRFHLKVGQTLDKNKTGAAWDAAGLVVCWKILQTLPEGHVANNEWLENWTRWVGNYGWYNSDRDEASYAYTNPNSRWFKDTVRHEVGHAADAKLGSKTDPIKYDSGPKWKYEGTSDVLDAMIAAGGPIKSWSDSGEKDKIIAALRECMETNKPDDLDTKLGAIGLEARELASVKNDNAYKNVKAAASEKKKPWDNAAALPTFGTRKYHMAYDGGSWVSYEATALGKQVSGYQFRAPNEWFAEAYVFYYTPAANRGDKLKAKDAATKTWFDNNVHED